MQIEFLNTVADVKKAQHFFPWTSRYGQFIYLVICAVPGVALLLLCGLKFSAITCLALIAVMLVSVYFQYLSSLNKIEDGLVPTTLSIHDRYLETRNRRNRVFQVWSNVTGIIESNELLFIGFRNNSGLPIPKSAFDSQDRLREFVELVQQKIDHSTSNEADWKNDLPDFDFGPGASESALINVSATQLADFAAKPVEPDDHEVIKQSFFSKSVNWVMLLFAIGFATYLVLSRGDGDSISQVMVLELMGFFTFWITYILIAIYVPRLLKLRSKSKFDELIEHQFVTTQDGLVVEVPGAKTLNFWEVFERIEQYPDFLILPMPEFGSQVIPSEAFRDKQHEERFFKLTKRYLGQADILSNQTPITNTLNVDVQESGNPYQPPQAS